MPWPIYYLAHTPTLLRINEFFKFKDGKWKEFYENWTILKIKLRNIWSQYRTFIYRNIIAKTIATIINIWFILHALYYLFGTQIGNLIKSCEYFDRNVRSVISFLESYNAFFRNPHILYKVFIILFVLFFISFGRKLLWTIGRYILPFMKFVPDSKTLKFYLRYFNIIRFAGYEESFRVYSKLINQYDQGTGFVVLPMDMHYVGAGKIKSEEGTFEFQMNELVKLKKDKKKNIYPFVFIDPRRIKDQPDFLKFQQII
ncbi:MAG: hypothetical protein IPP06_07750 [Saprospiraceae bacterium]|nr:hypothetical protein [Candidatus Vicinibacter affinis]